MRRVHLAKFTLIARSMFTVAVEGNIGSGKSTFLNFFKQFPTVESFQEPVEQWTTIGGCHNALNLLYENPLRWSFLFNQYAMLSRIKQHTSDVNCSVKMMERSLFSTQHVFVQNTVNSGLMSDLEYVVLSEWFTFLVSSEKVHVDLFVYLRVSPEVCFQRIQSRGRNEENHISLDFLTKLHELHEELMVHGRENGKLPGPVLILDADKNLDEMYEVYSQKKDLILQGFS